MGKVYRVQLIMENPVEKKIVLDRKWVYLEVYRDRVAPFFAVLWVIPVRN